MCQYVFKPNEYATSSLTLWLNKKRQRLTSPAIGVGSLFTLLMVPGLILLIRL